ncbi:NADPH-dependent F420 reductase [Plantactinospora endophytica]|uniref:NADP oxidoreductase n=1 Tax=Plantactinospora endophytica TaxID=673535 RepID=A0ABQ4EDB7_9ACTN|nr:NAD(P)-binding domain-containing protein [Plantactinospora endophytica]GIG92723.1 NADP oxidoreductase [Plantactinospora endophytica]
METIGILGAGNVGRALATRLHEAGCRVLVGVRDPDRPPLWLDGPADGPRRTGLPEAASAAIVVNALPGAESVRVLRPLRPTLAGAVLVDVANAVELGPDGLAGALCYPGGSLAEEIQRTLPETSVVKTLNTVGPAELMTDPTSLAAPLSAFLSGDDGEAKALVAGLLGKLGWPAEWIVDLGALSTAWWPESFVLMVRPLVAALGPVPFGLAVAR